MSSINTKATCTNIRSDSSFGSNQEFTHLNPLHNQENYVSFSPSIAVQKYDVEKRCNGGMELKQLDSTQKDPSTSKEHTHSHHNDKYIKHTRVSQSNKNGSMNELETASTILPAFWQESEVIQDDFTAFVVVDTASERRFADLSTTEETGKGECQSKNNNENKICVFK